MANRELSFNLGLSSSPSSNIEDSEIYAELQRLYQAVNLLAAKLDEYTGVIPEAVANRPYVNPTRVNRAFGMTRFYAEAAVDLVKGTIVSLGTDGLLVKALPSKATVFIVLEDTAAGNHAPAARHAVVDGFVGLTPGTSYVNSTTAGAIATSVATGNTRRYLGIALNSTTFYFCPDIIGVAV